MSIARVETPSACSSNSSPGNRADASFSVAPQLRIDLRSTRMYSPASAAAIATATVPLFTSDTDQGGLACAPSSHAASDVPRRDRSGAQLRLAPTRTARSLGGRRDSDGCSRWQAEANVRFRQDTGKWPAAVWRRDEARCPFRPARL